MEGVQLLEPSIRNEDALPKAFSGIVTVQLKAIAGLMGICVRHVESRALHMHMAFVGAQQCELCACKGNGMPLIMMGH